ncbi:MAG: zinc ribbon domain-containing protein [Clostridiales Family XIII bacterium]|jgi:hypothetical protein|nr:zinc ribbon domain-containing protein [Clostridiales Family XIII bacterium]
MICGKCGNYVNDHSRFCSHCGTDVLKYSGAKANNSKNIIQNTKKTPKHIVSRRGNYDTSQQTMAQQQTPPQMQQNKPNFAKRIWTRMSLFSKIRIIFVVFLIVVGGGPFIKSAISAKILDHMPPSREAARLEEIRDTTEYRNAGLYTPFVGTGFSIDLPGAWSPIEKDGFSAMEENDSHDKIYIFEEGPSEIQDFEYKSDKDEFLEDALFDVKIFIQQQGYHLSYTVPFRSPDLDDPDPIITADIQDDDYMSVGRIYSIISPDYTYRVILVSFLGNPKKDYMPDEDFSDAYEYPDIITPTIVASEKYITQE